MFFLVPFLRLRHFHFRNGEQCGGLAPEWHRRGAIAADDKRSQSQRIGGGVKAGIAFFKKINKIELFMRVFVTRWQILLISDDNFVDLIN